MNDKTQNSMNIGIVIAIVSILVNAILFAIKYQAGLETDSIALIADAWHSLSDSLTSFVAIFSMHISMKPADREHPFGHGRVEIIGSIIIAIVLAFVSIDIIRDSLTKIENSAPIQYSGFAIAALVVSILAKEMLAWLSFFIGKKIGSRSLRADAWHHRSDSISTIIILVGIFFKDDIPYVDSILGIVVAVILFYTAYRLLGDNISPLIGEKPEYDLILKIKEIANFVCEENVEVHHIHIHNYGKHSELTFHIKLPGHWQLFKVHQVVDSLEGQIRKEMNVYSTIHVDPRIEKGEFHAGNN